MPKKLLAYVSGQGTVNEQDAKKLTHIQLAFGKLRMDGSIVTHDVEPMMAQMAQLRAWNPDLKIGLSLVNNDGEMNAFTTVCADPALREAFGKSCVDVVTRLGFDGVDIDWEYPCVPSNNQDVSKDDRANFTATCRVRRQALDTVEGKHPLLTLAAGADVYYPTCVDLAAVSKDLDFINLMTYDLKCGFHALAGHHTQLYSSTGDVFQNSCDQALRLFVRSGVPKDKLLMGAAFYSRKWENIQDRNHGFLQISKTGGGYGPNWARLEKDFLNKNGYVYYWDDEAKAPFLFNGSTFLSFDDPRSLKEKCEYVRREDYAGIFYWEHTCDPTGVLLDTLYQNLKD